MRHGQVALYLLMTLVVVTILACMDAWIYVAVRNKDIVQNAGDAAVITVAAEQGRLLNRIGELNLEHMGETRPDRLAEIEREQRRLCLLGPVKAVSLSSQSARNENVENQNSFAQVLQRHLDTVNTVYSLSTGPDDPYPPSWPGAWGEYAEELSIAINNGVAAGPDNIEYYDGEGSHPLLNGLFYDAVNGRAWCWFHFNCPELLENYRTYEDWPAIGGLRENSTVNSEVYSLHLKVYRGPLVNVYSRDELREILRENGRSYELSETAVSDGSGVWFLYDGSFRREWSEIKAEGFPVLGPPRAEYDYLGCAAVTRTLREDNKWVAAARPFGVLGEKDLVLPVFTGARLIPIDAARGGSCATSDLDWCIHVKDHLPPYLESGELAPKCNWCATLRVWDQELFRMHGRLWLRYHADTCRRGTSSGGGSGGTPHGH